MAWAPFLICGGVLELTELIIAADLIADTANGADQGTV
jgi:hypothetical protein